MRLQYFGTDTREAGHYFWNFDGGRMNCDYLKHFKSYGGSLPFDPENIFRMKTPAGRDLPNGHVEFHQIEGYTILAIVGSPADRRGGCKMVFFVKGIISRIELVEIVTKTTAAYNIIQNCKFSINLI
jgi:hypothetical protein